MTELILGECPSCQSITVSPPPEQEYCAGCRETHGPRSRLVRRVVPAGCRLDLRGSIHAPDGRVLVARPRPEAPDGEVARLRRLLHDYDRGVFSEGDVEGAVFCRQLEYIADHLRRGETVSGFSSWCGGEIPPPVTVRAEIELDAQSFTVRPT